MGLETAIQNVRAYLRDMDGVPGYEDDEQLIASAPPVPPDGGSQGMITIGDLRTIIAAHGRNGWNIEEDGAALKICKGGHDKTERCQFERYVPADHANSEIGESDNAAEPGTEGTSKIVAGLKDVLAYVKGDKSKATLLTVAGGKVTTLVEADEAGKLAASERISAAQVAYDQAMDGHDPFAPDHEVHAFDAMKLAIEAANGLLATEPFPRTIRATYLEGRMRHWLGEAQRLAALVTALGGNPEPDTPQPLEAPGEERYRNKEAQAPAGVVDHLRARLESIAALWAANGQPDHGQIAFLLRVAESYVNLPVLSAAAWERAEICKVLGIVDKPGVPLKHIEDILARKAKAHEREIELLKSWDRANLTERQELDRFRRGWGPSTPTERQRRREDVARCLQILSRALSDLSTPEEEAENFSPEAQAVIDAAHDAVDKHHTEILIIHQALLQDPQEWPDIRAAEERGALAMREILKERVSGLKIIQTPMQSVWEVENRAFDGAVFQIETAPMPRDYHGNAREKVQKILANEKPAA